MNKVNSYSILLILFLSSTSFSQIWLVKNVSNVFPDDCYISFGNNLGIAYCLPQRYVEPQKITDWDDDALCYVLYPVYPLVMNNEAEVEKNVEEKSKKRKSKRKRADQKEEITDSVQVQEAPKWEFITEDSLFLTENGEIIYRYEDILLYKTYTPLQDTDITSYRTFQLFKPSATDQPLYKNQ